MIMRKLLAAGSLGVLAVFGEGCANACEAAASRVDAKYEECGIGPGDGGEDGDAECTQSATRSAEALAACIEKATCDDVRSGLYLTKC